MEFIQLTGAIGGILTLGGYLLWRNAIAQRRTMNKRLAELTIKLDTPGEHTYEEYAELNALRGETYDGSVQSVPAPEGQALVSAGMLFIGLLVNAVCVIAMIICIADKF